MASLASPQPRPRPLSVHSTSSAGPYLSPYLSPTQCGTPARRRTSQTFRPSPLAGPALSYSSVSAVETSTTSHESSPSSSLETSSHTSSDTDLELRNDRVRANGTLKANQRRASTIVIATSSGNSLQPPLPAWRSNGRRSTSLNSRMFSRSSTAQSTPTLSSLISLTISEAPQPHGDHFSDSHRSNDHKQLACFLSEKDAPHLCSYESLSSTVSLTPSVPPSRRHSRLSFAPPPSTSSSLSAPSSSASSLRSITSTSSMRSSPGGRSTGSIKEEDATDLEAGDPDGLVIRVRTKGKDGRKDDDGNKVEKHNRRSSVPAPVEKHDWLTAVPTPIFSRSALKTQNVIMPVSARERRNTVSSHNSHASDVDSRKRSHDKNKVEEDKKMNKVKDEKTSDEKKGSLDATSEAGPGPGKIRRRLTQCSLPSRMPSLSSIRSSKKSRGTKQVNGAASQDEHGGFGVLDKSSVPPVPPLPQTNLASPSKAYLVDRPSSPRRPSTASSSSSGFSPPPDTSAPNKESIQADSKHSPLTSTSFTGILRRLTMRQRS